MASKILALLALASVVAFSAANAVSYGEKWYERGTPGFNYDCSGKVDGNYPHPTKCTHYVACVAQTEAYEMVCALNHDGQPLHYVQDSGPNEAQSRCDYPAVAGCEGPTPTAAPTQPPTAAPTQPPTAAPTQPPTAAPTQPSTAAPTQPPTAAPTAAPTQPPTAAPTQPPTTVAPGNDCDPEDCQLEGECRKYFFCNNITKKWEQHECGTDLFWNDAVNNIHGGSCDFFENLDGTTQDRYRGDENCIEPCAWLQTPQQECTGQYTYRERFDNHTLLNRITALVCPSLEGKDGNDDIDLVWDQNTKTCERCSEATDHKGNSCSAAGKCT